MPLQPSPPIPSVIQEWDKAGSSLSSALEKYQSLSENLSMELLDNAYQSQLTSRIDSALQSRHVILNRQLSQVHSRLAQTRNVLSSRAHTLPREILTEIFMNVIYTPPEQCTLQDAWMDTVLLKMFRDLSSLQCVCRTWRNIIISQRSFWYFALIYCTGTPPFQCTRGPSLSLERSQGDLHLAAVMKANERGVIQSLQGISRYRTVNLCTSSHSVIKDLISKFSEPGPPLALSELSLYQERDRNTSSRQPPVWISSPASPAWPAFCELLKTLAVLRIRGAHLSWNHMAFSDRLVEVRIQEVMIGSDSVFIEAIGALSLAPKLRDLQIISIRTTFDTRSLGVVAPENQIHFPNLESLYVEDLAYNSLVTVLDHISPGSHRLKIHLTERCIDIEENDSSVIELENLCIQLKDVTVDTLLLGENQGWIEAIDLHVLLCSMPDLKVLKMSGWLLDEEEWQALVRPQVAESEIEAVNFPELQYLDLSCVRVTDQEFLQQVVTSHSIQRLSLGGLVRTDPEVEGLPGFSPFQGNEAILDWLRQNVPEFTLADPLARPSEFSSNVWQLW